MVGALFFAGLAYYLGQGEVPSLNAAFKWRGTDDETIVELAKEKATTDTVRTNPWSGFRGPHRDSSVDEKPLPMDWVQSPPEQIWQRNVGPASSSMAVANGLLFTQTQIDQRQCVTCYNASNGELVWTQEQDLAFSNPVWGAGPRCTPCIADAHVYALSARGILQALNTATGELRWSRDLKADFSATLPDNGFEVSPLVIDDHVLVYLNGVGLVGLDTGRGETEWFFPQVETGFIELNSIHAEERTAIVLVGTGSAIGIEPGSGKELWRFDVSEKKEDAPKVTRGENSRLLFMPQDQRGGVSCLTLRATDQLEKGLSEAWSNKNLKLTADRWAATDDLFFLMNQGELSCVDVLTGETQWRTKGWGLGSILSFRSAKQLIVLSETGDVVLVQASKDRYLEQGRMKLLKGPSRNHPAFADGKLYIRSDSELACYDLN